MRAILRNSIDFFHVMSREDIDSIAMHKWLYSVVGGDHYSLVKDGQSAVWRVFIRGQIALRFSVGDVIWMTDDGWFGKAREIHFFTKWKPVDENGNEVESFKDR